MNLYVGFWMEGPF